MRLARTWHRKNKFLLIIKTVIGVIQLSIRIKVAKTHDYYLLVQCIQSCEGTTWITFFFFFDK